MDELGVWIDVFDPHGRAIGRKRRGDIDKRRDRYHSVHGLIITPGGDLVLSVIPPRPERPQLYTGRLGSTVATMRRSDESAEQAVRRALEQKAGLRHTLLCLWGEAWLRLPDGLHRHMSGFVVRAEIPPATTAAEIGQLHCLRPRQLERLLAAQPSQVAPTLQALWMVFGGPLA